MGPPAQLSQWFLDSGLSGEQDPTLTAMLATEPAHPHAESDFLFLCTTGQTGGLLYHFHPFLFLLEGLILTGSEFLDSLARVFHQL